LTPRQHNVLHYLVAGYTNPEIAEELVISVKTVEAHVSQVLAKLEASSRREVVAWVRERHLTL